MNQPAKQLIRVRMSLATARNARPVNQDALGVSGWVLCADQANALTLEVDVTAERPLLLAVVDGMGGPPQGELAARIAAQTLTGMQGRSATTLGQLTAMFDAADAAIHTADGKSVGMGCAAALVGIDFDGRVVSANVGDVRVYRVVDGYAGQLSRDDRSNTAAGTLTRCLGGVSRGSAEPYLFEVRAQPGERFMVCTDGLYDAVQPATIRQCVTQDVSKAAHNLVEAALQARRGDNIAVAVLDILR